MNFVSAVVLAVVLIAGLTGCGNPVNPYTMSFSNVSLVPYKVIPHSGKIHVYLVTTDNPAQAEESYVAYELGRYFDRGVTDPHARPEGRLPSGFYDTLTAALEKTLVMAGYTVTTGDTPPVDAETSVKAVVKKLEVKRASECEAKGDVLFVMQDLTHTRKTLELTVNTFRAFRAYASNTVYQDTLAGAWRNAETLFLPHLNYYRTGEIDPEIKYRSASFIVSPDDNDLLNK